MSVLLLIGGLMLFVGLVVVHEFGHFIVAKRGGVDIEEFGIGFPPRVWSRRTKAGWRFSLNALPIGGFVRLKGEHDADRSPGSFGAATTRTKAKIMLAGVVMNLLTAFVLLTILAAVGVPKLIDNQFSVSRDERIVKQDILVGYVEPGSPADKAGLKLEDQIEALGTKPADCPASTSCVNKAEAQHITTPDELKETTRKNAGKAAELFIVRGGKPQTLTVQLRDASEVAASETSGNPKGYLGVAPTSYIIARYTWSAPVEAAGLMGQITALTFKGLGTAIAGLARGNAAQAGAQVAGPVGIFVLLRDGSLLGYQFVLLIIAIISLTLAIMNVLPLPALDGGRLFVMLLFRWLHRPLRKGTEELIHGLGFAFLMLLFILITVVDVRRFFS